MYYRAVHGTLVVFLQNDAGYEAWTPTDASIQALLDAYKPCGQKRKADDDNEEFAGEASPEKKRRMSESGVSIPAMSHVKDLDPLSQSDGLLHKATSFAGAGMDSYSAGDKKSDGLEQSPVTAKRGSSIPSGLPGADRKSNNGDEAEQMSPVTARRGSSVSSLSSGSPLTPTWPADFGGAASNKRRMSSSDNSDVSPVKRSREDSLSSPPLSLKSDSESDTPTNTPTPTTNKRTNFAAVPPPPPSKWSKIKDSPQQSRNKITNVVTPPQNFFKKRPGLGFAASAKKNSDCEETTTPKKTPPVDPFDFDEEEDSTPTPTTPTKSESQTKHSRTSRSNSGNSRAATRELRSRRR